jgi:hypothetical protein
MTIDAQQVHRERCLQTKHSIAAHVRRYEWPLSEVDRSLT